jgi:hypothetical protein
MLTNAPSKAQGLYDLYDLVTVIHRDVTSDDLRTTFNVIHCRVVLLHLHDNPTLFRRLRHISGGSVA